ncbi:hypothetical protein [Endozoicomonas atrinae]|uniref:hypothetical protein n=1 Tax=Endozoicomonas atrinae TaxID=1333660 RepID=UPI0008265EE2|nr:hypothetical protein [Endozoicomonas atrinae]
MTVHEIAEELSKINNPFEWSRRLNALSSEERSDCKALAEPLWIKRMINQGLLLVHPDIASELKENQWLPSQLHRKMIWASILASIDGPDSKEQFQAIKDSIKKKYGFHWWEDVYKRVKPAYAARDRIRKNECDIGPGLAMVASKSTVVSYALYEQRSDALRMIPKL